MFSETQEETSKLLLRDVLPDHRRPGLLIQAVQIPVSVMWLRVLQLPHFLGSTALTVPVRRHVDWHWQFFSTISLAILLG